MQFVDLLSQDKDIRGAILDSFKKILERGDFILGKEVHEFEKQAAKYLNVKYAIAVNSGTDALLLALKALNMKEGSEVITTPFTFYATTQAILYTKLQPVFVDIDPETFNLDATLIERAITPKTRAILPVHLFGAPASMEPIMKLAAKYRLQVIEDCAQAFGTKYQNRNVGTFGDCGCFSFYPTKNLGAYGDAGLITTDDDRLAERLLILRNQGCKIPYRHHAVGTNSRCDTLQAAVLLAKLPFVDVLNTKRRNFAERYRESLSSIKEIELPIESPETYHVYHQFTIKTRQRDQLAPFLAGKGIETRIYYDVPLHQQEIAKSLSLKPPYPLDKTEECAATVLSLPISPGLEEKDIDRVIDGIKEFYNK